MTQKTYDILIVGAGLTGLTAGFYITKQGKTVAIVEKQNRVGGQIQTFEEDGFIFEKGPNTGVISYPEVAELFQDLAPLCSLETAREESKRRLIWKGNRFHEIPSSLLGGVTTPLFSLFDKFRLLGEPFRKKGNNPNESVAQLTRRRMGNSFLDYAVDPFLSGVYAGNPEKLITRYALPKLYNLEQEYGGFIKGAMAKAKIPKSDRDKLATKKVFSATNGLEQLPKAMAKRIGLENIFTGADKLRITPGSDVWDISFTTKGEELKLQAKQVITTTGAYALQELLPFIDSHLMDKITCLEYAPVVQISVGIKDTKGLSFNAFGGLVPSKENREVLGILYPSACFEGRAPKGGALFSFFIGGVKHHELTTLSDEELEALVIRNFHSMLKFPTDIKPDMIKIFRHKKAIPQYELSSGDRFEAIRLIENKYPTLTLAGNIIGGIGMSDRIRQGVELATKVCK
ncbi:protoporphyrinogen oxidase [Bacteroides propionicifaciens]|jgi:protoporphyrinogen/coproporphyrinogen III oxidase|uniref:protoporphyrinogen oxidase n=1 Tax=Bacteroides propionicifaciens TaxID=392838 RepID=UPI0003655709|nr:protoporphyrinogen oxidase [Bacteroides propionicifaciens]